jgi:hypothetical protein
MFTREWPQLAQLHEREREGEREHSWRIREGTYVVEVKEAKGP